MRVPFQVHLAERVDRLLGRLFVQLARAFESPHGLGDLDIGQVRDVQRDFLFGQCASEVGSVALVPLGKKSEIGFLAIGSIDSNRFHPGMSMDFLKRLGQLVAEALRRY